MSDHTEGKARIAIETGPCVVAVGEREICECYQDGETQTAEDEANARRVVACWNACDGIGTVHLENANSPAEFWKKQAREERDQATEQIGKLKSDRAAILSALRDHDGWLERTGHGADHPWRLSIARVIAKHSPKSKRATKVPG